MKGSTNARLRARAVVTLVHDIDSRSGESRVVTFEGARLTSAARFCAEVWAEVRPPTPIQDQGVTAIRMVVID